MEIYALASSLLILTLAAVLQGFLGFGFGLLAMTALAFQFELAHAAGVVNLGAILVAGGGALRLRRAVLWPTVARYLPGILVGVALGLLALGRIDGSLMLPALGVVVIVIAGWNLVWPRRLPSTGFARHLTVPVGLLGGFLGGAFNTGGPPLVAHLYVRDENPDALRGTLQILFLSISLSRAPLAWSQGMLGAEILFHAMLALPCVLLGLGAGLRLGRRVSPRRFRRSAWFGLGVLGLALIANA